MRKSLVVALAFLLAFVPLFAGAQEMQQPDPDLFYDKQVFVGDSITRQLKLYLRSESSNGSSVPEPVFLHAQGYMLYSASRNKRQSEHVNLTYRGKEMPMCQIVGQIKPQRVFILLGVNDYAGRDIPKNIGYCERILELIARYSPDTQVFFFSLTPVTRRFCKEQDLRTLWNEYNLALETMCAEKGAHYIDIATPLKDADGYLKTEYCSDGLYHLSPAGLQVWLDTLRSYATAQYEQGMWMTDELPAEDAGQEMKE